MDAYLFSDRITRLLSFNITRADLARLLDLSPQNLGNATSGHWQVSAAWLIRMTPRLEHVERFIDDYRAWAAANERDPAYTAAGLAQYALHLHSNAWDDDISRADAAFEVSRKDRADRRAAAMAVQGPGAVVGDPDDPEAEVARMLALKRSLGGDTTNKRRRRKEPAR